MKYDDPEVGVPDVYYYYVFYGGTTITDGAHMTMNAAAVLVAAGDINNDGQTDLIFNNAANFLLRVAQDNGFKDVLGPPSTSSYGGNALVIDYDGDGDGLDDIVVPKTSPNNWQVSRSQGGALAPFVDLGIPAGLLADGPARAADLNGDGLAN